MSTLMPLIWVILSSFKTNQEIFTSTFSLPREWQIQNYINAIRLDGLFEAFRNTIAVSVICTFITTLVASMASYALMQKFKLTKKIYYFLIAGIYVPINAFMVPYFILSIVTKTYNTIWALIMVYSAINLPMAVLILKAYMDTIPKEICESAVVDGCSFSKTFFKIILPLSLPGMSTIGVFQFIMPWNEFLFATILTQDKASRTLQVSIRFFMGTFVVDYASMFATMVVCLVPTIFAYILFQEQVISGLTSGALKA
ncbi:MAG TPA: carbohydrate ABC transporter permease [Clostridiaceae bacterium]|nr:carbohydrate ABC transporter permease [Clostridiaceae bacterium]